jgi:pimeloyl-ACP methyl ester carboxylesterase
MAQIRLLLRPEAFRANAEDVAALHGAVSEMASRYGELKPPLVAFHGLPDQVTYASIHSEPLPGLAPAARFVPLAGVGHMPHHAIADEIAAVIAEMAGR